MDKAKLSDILLGGAGGAIVAAVIAVFFSMYQESIRNSERVEAKNEILSAKKQVMEEIWKARSEERSHLLKAINDATSAKVESNAALSEAKESLLYIEEQKSKVDQFVSAIEKGGGVSVEEIAQTLEATVVSQLLESFSKNAVVAFNSRICPNGWREFKPAYGRFIRGVDKSGNKIDPEGDRVIGHIQGDALKKHSHSAKMEIGAEPLTGKAQAQEAAGAHGRHGTYYTSAGLVVPYGSEETRPKNVALLYCIRI